MIALYELAVQVPGRTTRLHYLGASAAIAVAALIGDDYGYPWFLTILNPVLFLLLPVALAESTRLRHDYLSAVKARADYAERNRENEARHRVAEERVRIARELHDVVAHHLALANAQAGTAAYLADTRPEGAQRILNEMTATTSAALRELKATVGLLRQHDDTAAPLEPAPGLEQLPELTAAFATVGLEVNVLVEGEERQLSPGVDLTAYRIVQEALTNVTKHATTTTASVRLTYREDRLTITIANDTASDTATPTLAQPGVGYGLLGMRERAHTAGGQFQAGPQPDGGFTVTTELPIRH